MPRQPVGREMYFDPLRLVSEGSHHVLECRHIGSRDIDNTKRSIGPLCRHHDGLSRLLIGEQPGDQEDIIGRPFVGPAGQILDRALEAAGIDRRTIYITNAVKHFKFTPRGTRRIHQTPDAPEIQICRFWLDAERTALNPTLLVLLGGSACATTDGFRSYRPHTW